jgi:hypothetical protein
VCGVAFGCKGNPQTLQNWKLASDALWHREQICWLACTTGAAASETTGAAWSGALGGPSIFRPAATAEAARPSGTVAGLAGAGLGKGRCVGAPPSAEGRGMAEGASAGCGDAPLARGCGTTGDGPAIGCGAIGPAPTTPGGGASWDVTPAWFAADSPGGAGVPGLGPAPSPAGNGLPQAMQKRCPCSLRVWQVGHVTQPSALAEGGLGRSPS